MRGSKDRATATRVLVAGWFSFGNGHATAGDVMARDLVCRWLDDLGWPYDVSVAPPFTGGVDWTQVDATLYSHVIFVCGPFGPESNERAFLRKFWRSVTIGLNLSMKVPLHEWNPFDLLIERNSTRAVHADLVFGASNTLVPLVGVCRVEDYPEGMTAKANALIDRLLAGRHCTRIEIDTRLDENSAGLRTPQEIETALARMDVVVTTRLHAMVMALRNGVPVVSIDPEPGGAKIIKQATLIGWTAFAVDRVADQELAQAFDYCLTEGARRHARDCSMQAAQMIREIHERFTRAVSDGSMDSAYISRLSSAQPPPPDPEPQRPRGIAAVVPEFLRRGIATLKGSARG